MQDAISIDNPTNAAQRYHSHTSAVRTNQNTSPGSGSPAKVKVLVADDEQVIADTLTVILNRSGFQARAVYSGTAAISALSSFDPDILISDVMMPGMTGIEAAVVILAQRPACKVLLFSGQAATVDLLYEARAQGHSFEVLTKPIHPADLLAKLRASVPVATYV